MAANISIVDGEYKINSGSWTNSPGTISNGDQLTVRRTSSASFSTEVDTTVTVGTYSTDFSITTKNNPVDDLFLVLGGSIIGSTTRVDVELEDVSGTPVSIGEDITVQVQLQLIEIATGDTVTTVPFATITAGTTFAFVTDYDNTAFTFVDSFIMSATPNPADGKNLIYT